MTALLADRIRAVLALADAATPGPWSVEPRHHAQNQVVETDCLKTVDIGPETFRGRSIATVWKPGDHGWQDARPNAAFIAAAPEMAALLRECLEDDGWQTIESAPRDGSVIVGYWYAKISRPNCYGLTKYESGYWCGSGNNDDLYSTPDYWRPLPAAPAR